jgi:guanosine-3',5'-bis(diphosphate) 3'-pyrophosphohydrolase
VTENDQGTNCAAGVQRILAAARFAAEKHASLKRKGQAAEPYINHLIEVAELIAASSEALDVNLVMAGFLHDTIEDAGVTAQELQEAFGSDVAALVVEATDDKRLPKETRKALQVENAPHKTPRAQTLKLADKISNLRSLSASPPADWSPERKRQYCEWARQVVSRFPAPNRYLMAEFEKVYVELTKADDRVKS